MDLSDGSVVLRAMTPEEAETHLAGEDEQIIRFLTGVPSTIETVADWIRSCRKSREKHGPLRGLGIREVSTDRLVGEIKANLALPGVRPGAANLTYGLYPAARGKGYATRAVKLMVHYVREQTEADVAMSQVSPENAPSVAVAERAGFRDVGDRISMDGDRLRTFLKPLRA